MKIKWGSIVVNGSGKLGGHVYSKNRGGNYVRTLATPSNPQTSFQQSGRSVFTGLTQGWSGLTQSERDSWNGATANFQRTDQFGDIRELSGKGLYISLNKELILVGQSALSVAPTPSPINVPTSLTVGITLQGGGFADILLTAPGILGTDLVVVKATPVLSAGTSFVKNKLRTVVTGEVNTVFDEQFLYDQYKARFGELEEGDKVAFSIYVINEAGQRSPQVGAFGVTVNP